MKKKLSMFMTIICFICLPNILAAEDKMGIGVRAGGVWPEDIYSGYDSSGALVFGADFTYLFYNNIGFRFGIDYFNYDVDISGINLGDITVVPISINVVAQKKMDNFSPYIGFGASYLFNDIDLSGILTTAFKQVAGANLSASVDDNFGFFINGGVEAFVSTNVAIGIDLR